MKSITHFLLALVVGVTCLSTHAKVVSETIDYKDGDTKLTGYIYFDDASKEKRPGVLVIHEWWGLNDYAKKRAEMLAEMGYVAFAADMYGDKKVTKHAEDAKGWATQITSNIDAWQRRANRTLEILGKHKLVKSDDMAAIGYCFGGATVMQIAYSGTQLDGVVSFHGSLPVANEAQAKVIKTKVMIAHGYADSFIPKDHVAKFKQALEDANVDWQFHAYGGAHHSFTNERANDYGIDGLKYNSAADQRSWKSMQEFFKEIFSD